MCWELEVYDQEGAGAPTICAGCPPVGGVTSTSTKLSLRSSKSAGRITRVEKDCGDMAQRAQRDG